MSTIKTRRQYTKEFKLQVLREVEAGKSVASAAREHQLHPNCITKWRAELNKYGSDSFAGNGNTYTHEAKIAQLERIIGQQAVEITLLKKVLRLHDDRQAQTPQRGSSRAGGAPK